MRNVESHNNILQDKIDEAVTHYINVQQHESEQLPMDTNDLEYTTIAVQGDGGGRVTVMHQQAYPTMCRQVSEQGVEGQWNELELDEGRIAAIVAHLAQNQRTAHHHPQAHPKITSVRNVVDTSVILDGSRFNGQVLDNQTDSIVVDLPPLQSLPPLPNMKRCPETDWFHDKDKKNDASILTDSDSPVLDLNPGASPVQNKQSKKSLPHKKRISKKLKRNNGSCTPQQEVVVINGVHSEQEHEQILPDNYVTVQQSTHHIQHELRPVLICQICGVFYGEEQLKFFHHLKQHYEPHGAIIIENPVSDLVIDKMSNTCIVDNGSTLPDSIVELSLENTVPKTMYQSIDKHILYTTHDKTLNYNSNKVQYTIASVDKDVVQETEKTDLYETLDKLEFNNCGKCHKPVRKKHCEIHKREQAVNPKLEELSEFSEPEDLMAGIQVVVGEYEPPLLPLDHEHEHDHRHWTYGRSTSNGAYCPRTNDTQPLKVLKEEVLQRIFEGEVASGSSFTETIIPGAEHETEDHRDAHETHEAHEQDMPEQDMPEQDMPEQDMPEQDMPERDEHNEQEHCQEHSMDKCEQYNMEGKDMAYDDKSEDNDMKKNGRGRSKDKSTLSCGVCGRVFVHRNSLVYHALTHANKQHACYCGAGFYTRAALNIHKRVHSGVKPFKCDECGREFRQMGDLRYHKSSLHSDKKEFKCEFCGKEFARKYSLNVHRRIHTGEKNYPCHYCNKTFRASSYRLAHMKTHTGDRPHKCEVCDKNFRSSHDLRRHMQIHDKLQNKMDNAKIKIKDKKTKIDSKEKIILNESPSKVVKKIAVASTTARIPLIRKGKRKSDSKKAPNVTVQSKDCYEDVFELRNMELAKFKDVYSEVEKDDNLVPYKSQVYKESEEKDMATLRRMLKTQMDGNEKFYNRENTDGKMQVYTHVEKSNGSVNSNGLNEDTERHVEGEVIDNVFIAGLTALYNVPT